MDGGARPGPGGRIHPRPGSRRATAREYIENFYTTTVEPLLTPVTVDPAHPFPHVLNKALCLAFLLRRKRRGSHTYLGVVTVPRALPRLVLVPSPAGTVEYVFLHDVVHAFAERLSHGYEILSAAAFRVTRNSNLYLQEEESRNLLESVDQQLGAGPERAFDQADALSHQRELAHRPRLDRSRREKRSRGGGRVEGAFRRGVQHSLGAEPAGSRRAGVSRSRRPRDYCKLALVARRESDGQIRRYAHLGTGNYNPSTARFYTDLSLLTSDARITSAVHHVFNYLTAYSEHSRYTPLFVAPLISGLAGRSANRADRARRVRSAAGAARSEQSDPCS